MQQVFAVAGMTCGHCENAVRSEIMHLPGVRRVSVDLETGNVTIEADGALDHTAVQAAICDAGYELVT